MTHREFQGWQEYYQILPPSATRQDYHAAELMALSANLQTDKKSKFKAKDFLREWLKPMWDRQEWNKRVEKINRARTKQESSNLSVGERLAKKLKGFAIGINKK